MKKKKKVEKAKIDAISLTAHQLKEPLSSMKLSLKLLFKGDFGRINKEQKDIVEKIIQKNETLICLVENLLNATQIKRKKQTYNLSMVNVENLIECLINSKKEEIVNKKIEFKFEKSKDIPQIKLDEKKISIALQNIIDNAIKYTPIGGKIVISLNQNKNNLEIKIQDSGIGIPEDQRRKIFDRFFRADNAFKTEIAGFGLGLFIVKDIIKAHRGKIWFESQEGKGSTFFILLPIRPVV